MGGGSGLTMEISCTLLIQSINSIASIAMSSNRWTIFLNYDAKPRCIQVSNPEVRIYMYILIHVDGSTNSM